MNLQEALNAMHDVMDIWGEFVRSIRWENRFFPPEKFNTLFKAILEKAKYTETSDLKMYRARIVTPSLVRYLDIKHSGKLEELVWGENGLCGLPANEMGAPPKGCASPGRANPRGISYLYLADSPVTACAEVRPILSDLISVGEFQLAPNLRLVDLRNLHSTFSVNTLDGSESEDAKLLVFLETLCNSFSEPVSRDDELGYLPSQYIAAYWKKLKADGIIFVSHMNSGNNGFNVVLFDTKSATYVEGSSMLYKCTHIQSDFQNLSLGKSDPSTAKTEDDRLAWSGKAVLRRDISNIKRAYGGE